MHPTMIRAFVCETKAWECNITPVGGSWPNRSDHATSGETLASRRIALLVGLSACGTRFLSSRAKNPVVEDYLSASMFDKAKYGTLSTTAGRRIVLVHMESGKFCAEPPPDAAENVSSSIAAALSASLPSLGNT